MQRALVFFLLGLLSVGCLLIVTGLLMIARLGWQRALEADSEGHWPLPRKLLISGAGLAATVALLEWLLTLFLAPP
jgi:hypothetical protein